MTQTATQSYCNALYAVMHENSRVINIDGVEGRVWNGPIVETCLSVGIPGGSYRRVTKQLETLGCIEFVQRGARSYPSAVLLNYAPTEQVWQAAGRRHLTNAPTSARLAGRVKELETRIGGVNLATALVNIEKRLRALESLAGLDK